MKQYNMNYKPRLIRVISEKNSCFKNSCFKN